MEDETRLELLPIGRAAKLIGVHENTLRNWTKDGLVPFTKLPSGHRRFSLEQIEEIRTQMLQLKQPEVDDTKNWPPEKTRRPIDAARALAEARGVEIVTPPDRFTFSADRVKW